jgi:glucose-6-phosphate 1-epimerase
VTEFQGQPAVTLTAPDGARAVVLLHGAQLVSWVPAGGQEQLYLSPQSRFGEGASVRGGVPVIFPQFNERGPLPRHGLVRARPWQVGDVVQRADQALGVLRLAADAHSRAHWPHGFELELTVSVGGPELAVELSVTNTGEAPFDFMAALHTYLRTEDVTRVQLEGLQGCRYEDALRSAETGSPQAGTQWGDVTSVLGAIDRVYHEVPRALTLREAGRRLSLTQMGFEDVVVWNPGPQGAARLADLPDTDWMHMLCVEAARIAHPLRLAPGEDWQGLQSLRVE